jgi:tetratricopeptide (TPR) repeat protein
VAVFGGIWLLGRHRPPAEAVRWYEEGTRALRDGTSFTAMNALDRAVQLDPNFSLAHARLAEAATELDYTDKAKTEMLRASPPAFQSFFLSSEEKLRLEAVYFVLVKDFVQAATKYKELAAKAPSAERAAVLVDLGRAYEGGSKFQEALVSYSESIERDRQFAAGFLRRAVLEGRQQMNAKATSDFDIAEQLFRTEGKAEGLIEVLYQRATLLRRIGRFAEARAPAEKALEMARTSGDAYHQIRALLALSNISYSSGDTDGGQQQAQQAMDLARQAGIETLAASGMADIGNALFTKGDDTRAEPYLRNAIQTAKRLQAARIEARAELALEQVLLRQGHVEEAVAVSKDAMENFQKSGDKSSAARAAIPAARNLRDLGEYEAAISLFRQQLELAEQVKDDGVVILAAQGLGSTLLLQERYPAALESFVRSTAASRAIADMNKEAYSEGSRAEVLWRLGRYNEAEESLKNAEALAQKLNGNKPLLAAIYFTRAGLDLSRQKFQETETDIQRMLDASGPAPNASAKRLLGAVRVATGRAKEGRILCDESVQLAVGAMNVSSLKNSQLTLADARLHLGDAAGAKSLADELVGYFAQKHQGESELEALALAYSASSGQERSAYAERAKERLEALRHDLGAEAFASFSSRPDIHQIIRRAGLLSKEN